MSTAARAPRRIDPLLIALLVLAAAVRVALACQPLARLDGYVVPDDAYLSLTLARNLAHGLGPWYGTGWTNGFQPLFVFLMVPAFVAVPHDPAFGVRAAMALLIACDLATLALLWHWARATATSRLAPALAGLLWALSPVALQTALNGLETSLAAAALLAVFVARRSLDDGDRGWSAARLAGLGALIGLAGLARIDALIGAPVVAATLLFGADARRRPLARRLAAVALVAAVALAIFAPWPLYGHHWTGEWTPVSGRAVRNIQLEDVGFRADFAHVYRHMLLTAARTVGRRQAVTLGLLALMAAALPFVRAPRDGRRLGERLRPLGPLALTATLIAAAYVGYVFGAWYFARYLFVLGLPLTLAAAALADHLAQGLRGAAARVAAVALPALVVVGSVAHPVFHRSFHYGSGAGVGYMNIGLWARDHLPAGSRVGALQCGALGYFAEWLTVVNLDGVVNNAAYRAMRARRLLAYVRAQRLDYMLGWRDDARFVRDQDPAFADGDIVPVERVRGFATWGESWFVFHVSPAPSPRPVPPGR